MTLTQFTSILQQAYTGLFNIPINLFGYSFTFGNLFFYFWRVSLAIFFLTLIVNYGSSGGQAFNNVSDYKFGITNRVGVFQRKGTHGKYPRK